MKIIITRPEEDAGPLAVKLQAMGHEPVMLPLIKIETRRGVEIPNRNYQFIFMTSANGVRVIENSSALQHIPVLAVGPQSKAAALRKGFSTVSMQGGDVTGLAKYVKDHVKPSDGPLLYLSGSETSGDLEGKLKPAGFDVDRVVTYDAVPAPLTAHAATIAAAEAVMLYSPRTAKLWRQGIEDVGVDVFHIKHFCLSANVAAALPQSWHKRIATKPVESAMLELLDYNGKAE
jgi:uroporphyrinogen-III synthase